MGEPVGLAVVGAAQVGRAGRAAQVVAIIGPGAVQWRAWTPYFSGDKLLAR